MEQLIKFTHKKTSQHVLYFLTIMATIASLLLVYRYKSYKEQNIELAQSEAVKFTQKAASEIAQLMENLKKEVEVLSQKINSGKLTFSELEAEIKKKSAHVNGLGVAFLPYKFNPEKKLYAPYYVDVNNQPTLAHIEDSADYSSLEYERFALPAKQGAILRNPFFDPISKTVVIEYIAPLYKNSEIIGFVFANYSRDYMQQFVGAAFPSNLGYGEIVTKTGAFISHPNAEYIGQPKTGAQLAREAGNIDVAQKIENALSGKSFLFEEDANWISPEKSWNVFQPIPNVPWFAVGVFIIDEISENATSLYRYYVLAVFSIILLCLLFLLILIKAYLLTSTRLALASGATALAFIAAIIILWNKAYVEMLVTQDQMVEKSSFNKIDEIKKINPDAQSSTNPIITIPTGIYIHQLTIDNDSTTLSGYVWQKYPLKSTIEQGVMFPQAIKSTIEKSYSFTESDIVTVGYSIRCTLLQNFDLRYYPFDSQKIKIQIWPASLDNNVTLIPDFDSYKVTNPSALPGLNNKLLIQGWHLSQSYFTFQKEKMFTNFGIHSSDTYNLDSQISQGKNTQRNLPQLGFHIIADRYLYSTLILTLLPIFIILVLLFIILILVQHAQFYQIFSSIASLFFTSLIAYTAFKSVFSIQQIVFFDYIYFIVQFLILLISILTILYYKKSHIKWIQYKYMFIPQLIFWPLTTAAIYIVSMIFFY